MKKLLSIAFIFCMTSVQLIAQSNPTDYAGTFKLSENPYVKSVTISVKDSKIILAAEGFPESELTAGKAVDEYTLESMSATLVFTREAGVVKGLKIEAQGQVVTGVKDNGASLADYVASFKMADNEYVKKIAIAMKDGQLAAIPDDKTATVYILKSGSSKDVFSATVEGYDADVIFSRAEGKITAIRLSVAGGQVVLTGNRE
jgi:hypothetical protein